MPDFTEHDKAAHEDLAIMITDLLRGGDDAGCPGHARRYRL